MHPQCGTDREGTVIFITRRVDYRPDERWHGMVVNIFEDRVIAKRHALDSSPRNSAGKPCFERAIVAVTSA